MFRLILSVSSIIVAGMLSIPAQTVRRDDALHVVRSRADALLDQLVGEWRMVGDVRGHPVTYTLVARHTLADRYVELHMTDAHKPATYEARMFVGLDTVPNRVLVHWLDSFGAAFSVPAGRGEIVGDTLRFEIPYSTGPFRDTFVYHGSGRGWTFHLEQSDGRGGWMSFANYEVRSRSAPTRGGR